MSLLRAYQGALIKHLSTLFSYRCIMSISLVFAHPHRWTPDVPSGRSACVYKRAYCTLTVPIKGLPWFSLVPEQMLS
jgi:hypothetical protein